MPCIHTTDPHWIEYLRSNSKTQAVFWKRPNGKKKFNLAPNDYFYFVVKGTKLVAGRGKYRKQDHKSPEDAWNGYHDQLGSPTKDLFLQNIRKVLDDGNGINEIKCIELYEIEWFSEDLMFYFDEDTFSRKTQICKIHEFNKEQIRVLNLPLPYILSYYSQIEELNDILLSDEEPIDDVKKEAFIEGAKKLATHKTIERNYNLIKQAKDRYSKNCDICSMTFQEVYNIDYIEAHHKIPLKSAGKTMNSTDDIALLCANCHRAVHKKMAIDKNMKYEEIKKEIQRGFENNGG
jgi:hypothetical protein